jgi:hypothetical protein
MMHPYQLVSLWDMIETHAKQFFELGLLTNNAFTLYAFSESTLAGPLDEGEISEIRNTLVEIVRISKVIDLPVTCALAESRVKNTPKTVAEFDVIIDAMRAEIQSKLFLHVPSYRAHYYNNDDIVSDSVKNAFPNASREIISSSNAFAVSLPTACVFHAMRAAELGVRSLAKSLEVEFSFDISLADWQNLISQTESKITAIGKRQKSSEKSDDLQFYSECASQFRYFKDAWRVRVAHGRATYEENEANKILEHVCDFFESISRRLKE